ncbi:MAG: hypothetical protein DLM60_05790 [Pseudonocardiales bacterium]|nr:hypothetical protein [Actinomycetota bacterium]PZS21720.1 MAG: hypothetical protein DLM60_05790 [Pseudonocardiales bacterium]
MRIRTDDDVYRVDAVWLGPPKATFPWRARYVAWGVGMMTFLVVLGLERQLGIGFGFFSTGWGLLITILLTRLIGSRITHERPLTAVAAMWVRELTAPRKVTAGRGGAASPSRVRVERDRPRPGQRPSRRWGRRKERTGVRAPTSSQQR